MEKVEKKKIIVIYLEGQAIPEEAKFIYTKIENNTLTEWENGFPVVRPYNHPLFYYEIPLEG